MSGTLPGYIHRDENYPLPVIKNSHLKITSLSYDKLNENDQ
jgi:hypothetical protein